MSDESAARFEKEKEILPENPNSQGGRSVTLAVTLHPNGQIDFQFPKVDKTTLYGLLELTRAQLDKMFLMAEIRQATPPRGGVDGLLRRMNGGR